MNLLNHMRTIVDTLATITPDGVHIGGGACRDIVLGREVKDIDVILTGADQHQILSVCNALEALGYFVVDRFGSIFDGNNVTYAANEGDNRFDERWAELHKFQHYSEGHELDLLVAQPGYNLRSITDAFDYNINQYVLRPGDEVPVFLGEDEGILTKLRNDGVHRDRQLRMRQIAVECGWLVGSFDEDIDLPPVPPGR